MSQWLNLTCPVCGWAHLPKKFGSAMRPILYPAKIMTGGGRGKGFRVIEYLPWTKLPELRTYPIVWNSIVNLYGRLGAAYDKFYEVLGFLSPSMEKLLEELRRSSYSESYSPSFADYSQTYASPKERNDIADAYSAACLPLSQIQGGAINE